MVQVGVGRGGTRPGAGRPKSGTSSTLVLSIRIPRSELVDVERLAKRSNLSRQDWVMREIRRALQKSRPR